MPEKLKPGEEKSERIYVKGSKIPILHISRSIGDKVAHSVGVVSEPGKLPTSFNNSESKISKT
jgi:hypothetical protein